MKKKETPEERQARYDKAADRMKKIYQDFLRESGERRPNPEPRPPRDFQRAVKGYQTFQDLEPKQVGILKGLVIPSSLPLGGKAIHVLYRSGKWGEGTHDYIHDHDAGVKVACRDATGRNIAIPEFIRQAKSLYLLGHCLGFAYQDENGETVEAKVSRPRPEWYAIPSGKALLVIQTTGTKSVVEAVVWGGKLDVRDVGIVHN